MPGHVNPHKPPPPPPSNKTTDVLHDMFVH
jgi:hypothetical protein